MFKRTPSLTEQIKAHLKQRILNAEFEDGRIPPEMELANELNVSRSTIRDALSRLETEGVIFRKQGAGTFVNTTGLQVKVRLDEIWGYEAMLKAHGYDPSAEVVRVETQTPTASMISELNLSAADEVVLVEKRFFANDEPVILTCNYLPAKIFTAPYTKEDFRLPLYEFLPRFCRQDLAYFFSEIVPYIAPDHVATQLQLPPEKTALLAFEEIGFNQQNDPLLKSYSYFRDDVFRLRLIRRQLS
ncbi:MAG: GntR family transcriptional regulator [Caldilinea sp. CFX5]|nr:GntR family transcriptional regulator [Caldilinea sp. CFX5]